MGPSGPLGALRHHRVGGAAWGSGRGGAACLRLPPPPPRASRRAALTAEASPAPVKMEVTNCWPLDAALGREHGALASSGSHRRPHLSCAAPHVSHRRPPPSCPASSISIPLFLLRGGRIPNRALLHRSSSSWRWWPSAVGSGERGRRLAGGESRGWWRRDGFRDSRAGGEAIGLEGERWGAINVEREGISHQKLGHL
jgi:hypothetical protein